MPPHRISGQPKPRARAITLPSLPSSPIPRGHPRPPCCHPEPSPGPDRASPAATPPRPHPATRCPPHRCSAPAPDPRTHHHPIPPHPIAAAHPRALTWSAPGCQHHQAHTPSSGTSSASAPAARLHHCTTVRRTICPSGTRAPPPSPHPRTPAPPQPAARQRKRQRPPGAITALRAARRAPHCRLTASAAAVDWGIGGWVDQTTAVRWGD